MTRFRSRLKQSGEKIGEFPMFFHYVSVGPNVKEDEMIKDVYLPLSQVTPCCDQTRIIGAGYREQYNGKKRMGRGFA